MELDFFEVGYNARSGHWSKMTSGQKTSNFELKQLIFDKFNQRITSGTHSLR